MKYRMRVTYECTLVKTAYVEVEASSDEDAVEVAISEAMDDEGIKWEEETSNGDYYAELADESQEIVLEPIERLLRLAKASDERITWKMWGPRCEEYEPGCGVCEAWKWLDEKGKAVRLNDPAFEKQCRDAIDEERRQRLGVSE